LKNFMQKDLTEVKIFLKVLVGLPFLKHPVYSTIFFRETNAMKSNRLPREKTLVLIFRAL